MDVLLYLEETNPLQPRVIAVANQKGGVRNPTIFPTFFVYQEVFRNKVGIYA